VEEVRDGESERKMTVCEEKRERGKRNVSR
jgi:hypothetical protein